MTDPQGQTSASALRPTRLVIAVRALAGPLWRLTGRAAVLEVIGRRSGSTLRINLIPVDLDGKTYLLAFGGATQWSRNLRAAGVGSLSRRGRNSTFRVAEVGGDERERVIARYLRGTGPLKSDFNRKPDPADHPTFRLDPP